jgi:hypothetical protein
MWWLGLLVGLAVIMAAVFCVVLCWKKLAVEDQSELG